MRLTDLEPRWFSAHGDERHGLTFRCPHCGAATGQRLAVATHVDGTNFDPDPENPQQWATGEIAWTITAGSDFHDISLSPSVNAQNHWHGFITNGQIVGGV